MRCVLGVREWEGRRVVEIEVTSARWKGFHDEVAEVIGEEGWGKLKDSAQVLLAVLRKTIKTMSWERVESGDEDGAKL